MRWSAACAALAVLRARTDPRAHVCDVGAGFTAGPQAGLQARLYEHPPQVRCKPGLRLVAAAPTTTGRRRTAGRVSFRA
jgi:hypothetical protein